MEVSSQPCTTGPGGKNLLPPLSRGGTWSATEEDTVCCMYVWRKMIGLWESWQSLAQVGLCGAVRGETEVALL